MDSVCRRDNFVSAYKKKGLTLDKIADVTGITRSYISQYATGKHNFGPDDLRKIADCLGVATADIMS